MPNSRLIIDCQALEQRFRQIEREYGKQIVPMVKGNGYGVGSFEMASLYNKLGAPFVGVSYADEAIELRKKGYSAPILVLSCPIPQEAFDFDLTVILSSLEEAQKLHNEGAKRERKINVHLNLDLGLNRQGFRPDELFAALPFIKQSPWIEVEGLMSHFGFESTEAAAQFETIAKAIHPRFIHIESSKSLSLALPSCNLMRLGLTLLTNLTLESTVVSLRQCKKGESIGYYGEKVLRDMQVALLGIGYHDGLHQHYSGKGYVYIAGQKAAYVGSIYMDFLSIDVTGIDVKVGDRAEIFGPHIPLEEVASWGKTNPRQLLCCLGPRVKREYVNIRENVESGQAHCAL